MTRLRAPQARKRMIMAEARETQSNTGNTHHNKMKEVFVIVDDGKLDRPIFRRIGTGFVNRDDSLNIYLDAFPVSGRLHIRDYQAKKEGERGESRGEGREGRARGKEVA